MNARPGRNPFLGLWQQFPTPMASRFLAGMGWDFVVLDLQHGCFGYETTYECIHTLHRSGTEPWVRTSVGNYSEINKVLDLGARTVVVPMIHNAREAALAAAAGKYPPLGARSVGGDLAYLYGKDYADSANRTTRLIVQIEHIEAVESLDEILSLPGVDGIFLGPIDLALSMGLPREGFDTHPDYVACLDSIRDRCRTTEKLSCCNTYSLSEAGQKAEQGYDCITIQSDVDVFLRSTTRLLDELRQEVSTRPDDSIRRA